MIVQGRLWENINIGIKLRISVRRTDFLRPKLKAVIKETEQKTGFRRK